MLNLHRAHVVLGCIVLRWLIRPSVPVRGETGMCFISHVVEGPTEVCFPPGTAVMSSYVGRLGNFGLPDDKEDSRRDMEDVARHMYVPVVRADGPGQQWEAEGEFTVRIHLSLSLDVTA